MNDNPGWFLLLFGVFSLPLSLPLTLLLSSTISLNSRCNAWYAVNINTLAHSHWFRYHWNWHRNSMEGEGYESKVAVIYMQYSLAVNRPLVIHYIQQHPLAKYAFKCYESIFFRSFSSTGCLCISDHRKTRIIRLHQVSFPLWRLYRVLAHLTLSSGQTNLYHEYLCTHQTVKYKCEKLCMHAKHHFIFPSLEMFHYST